MRDDDERTAACIECREHALNQTLAAYGIKPCRRLIEQEEIRFGGKCECSEKTAALSSREPCGICTERLVESCGERPHDIGKLCRLKCLPDMCLIHILMQAHKIVARRCAEEITPLQGSSKEGA